MRSLFSPRRRRNVAAGSRRFQPGVEALEERCTPAAPQIIEFEVTMLGGNQVRLSGYVDDESTLEAVVNFSGAASGSAAVERDGYFVLETQASGLGTVTAVALDVEQLESAPATDDVASNVPTLSLAISYGEQNTVTVSGQVTDEAPGGLTVVLAGALGTSVTTDANGAFSYTTQATCLGTVVATTTDEWGQTSDAATVEIATNAPVIVGFAGQEESGDHLWSFTGVVLDENAAGLTVTFHGLASLEGMTTTVQSDGRFVITVQLQPGEEGTVWVEVTDWFGVASNQPSWIVRQE